jgi:hypothetical protein
MPWAQRQGDFITNYYAAVLDGIVAPICALHAVGKPMKEVAFTERFISGGIFNDLIQGRYIKTTKLNIIPNAINYLELVTLSGYIHPIAFPPHGILIASQFFKVRVATCCPDTI